MAFEILPGAWSAVAGGLVVVIGTWGTGWHDRKKLIEQRKADAHMRQLERNADREDAYASERRARAERLAADCVAFGEAMERWYAAVVEAVDDTTPAASDLARDRMADAMSALARLEIRPERSTAVAYAARQWVSLVAVFAASDSADPAGLDIDDYRERYVEAARDLLASVPTVAASGNGIHEEPVEGR